MSIRACAPQKWLCDDRADQCPQAVKEMKRLQTKNVVEIEKLYLKGVAVANGFDGKLYCAIGPHFVIKISGKNIYLIKL